MASKLDSETVRFSNLIIGAALLGVLAPLPLTLRSAQADGVANRPDVLGVDKLKPGMKGYGLTVFEGTKPAKFDVEIINVIPNFLPNQELILVKTPHPRLDIAKTVRGMSGSPIYIGGKMIGAYSYGWTFGVEPVAGVTPIRSMLDDLARPLPKKINGWPLKMLPDRGARSAQGDRSDATRFAGEASKYDVVVHAQQVAARKATFMPSSTSAVRQVATPLMIGGLNSGGIDMAKQFLEPLGFDPVQGGGSGAIEAGAPTRFEDGGAIGVQLARGDISMMGLGTVTRVEGDKLVAFGHPMQMSGVTALPTAVGRVYWFMATAMASMKMGSAIRPVGALVNDRQSSIVVSHSATAPVIPVTLKVKGAAGAPKTSWKYEVAHDQFSAPVMFAITLGNIIQSFAAERRDTSWKVTTRLKVKDVGSVEIKDFGVSIGRTPAAMDFYRMNAVQAVGALMNNPWHPVLVESADFELEMAHDRDIYMLRSSDLLDTEVDPGGSARVRLKLLSYEGKPVYKTIEVPIPKRFAGQTVSLSIQPGYVHRKVKPTPENVKSLLRVFEDVFYAPRSIIVSYSSGTQGATHGGRVMDHLPPGALDMMRPTTMSMGPEPFTELERHIFELPKYMIGQDSVSVRVRNDLR